jgi:hypothetical protein
VVARAYRSSSPDDAARIAPANDGVCVSRREIGLDALMGDVGAPRSDRERVDARSAGAHAPSRTCEGARWRAVAGEPVATESG